MMQTGLPIAMSVLALCSCAPTPSITSIGAVQDGPIVIDGVGYRVTQGGAGSVLVEREGRPFNNWEGLEARRAADRFCNGRARAGIRDRFKGNAWLIVGGCA